MKCSTWAPHRREKANRLLRLLRSCGRVALDGPLPAGWSRDDLEQAARDLRSRNVAEIGRASGRRFVVRLDQLAGRDLREWRIQ